MREHACFSGTKSKATICFSKDFCSFKINTIDDYNFILMIVSHELAHYIHKHNEHKDSNTHDTKSIESYADFFGAKILMTLITFGPKCKSHLLEIDTTPHSGELLNSIGRALSRLAETIFDTKSDMYSNRVTRIGYCAAGVTSFLDAYNKNLSYKRSMDVLTRLYSQGSLRDLIVDEKEAFHLDEEIVEKVNVIHNNIQGDQRSITSGLKPYFLDFIGTSYQVEPKLRQLYKEARVNIMREQGAIIEN
ncbi:ImmA/IrrE family metallo-endopeptidase [Pseudoalteromonas atlantica]|uniref:ImmA/IrrE family metallo-endopeptidase n=1 Tax=Pseudoalteromonas atlantica TaxID=288 RepID=UPI003A985B6A